MSFNTHLTFLAAITVLSAASHGQVYTFTTLAGASYLGRADGTGNMARFRHPTGVALDSNGNLFVADVSNSSIRKITTNGVVTTLAGLSGSRGSVDGTGNEARFNSPRGIAADQFANLYVTDESDHTIRRITPDGVVTTFAGKAGISGWVDGTGRDARFNRPDGVVVDRAGFVYVADSYNGALRRISPDGVVTTLRQLQGVLGFADGFGTRVQFIQPGGVAVDTNGSLFVTETWNRTIWKLSPGGNARIFAGISGNGGSTDGPGSSATFNMPNGLALDSEGNLYVADDSNGLVRKVIPAGTVTTIAGGRNKDKLQQFSDPHAVAVDSAGNIYVADTGNGAIKKVSPAGEVTQVAGITNPFGNVDGKGSEARFNKPHGLAIDNSGNLYVADTENHTIRKVSPVGVVTTIAISIAEPIRLPPNSHGEFAPGLNLMAGGVAVDKAGNVFWGKGHSISKMTSNGEITTFAGSANSSGSEDRTGSEARFHIPHGLVADPNGSIFVADGSNTIRKITSAGIVTTIAGKFAQKGNSDGTGDEARFNRANGLALDEAGNLFVADTGNHSIRKITPAGVVTTLSGLIGSKERISAGFRDEVGTYVWFDAPTGVAVDKAGNIFVVDSGGYTIRKVTPDGVVTTIAGVPHGMDHVDGIGSEARFFAPRGIVVDKEGNLFVSELGNNTIRKGTPSVKP